MQAMDTASKLDTKGWLIGIWGAVISGGAGSASATLGTLILDKKDATPQHLLAIAGTCFALPAIVSLMKYLQLHPIPDVVVTEVKQTVSIKTETTTTPGENKA